METETPHHASRSDLARCTRGANLVEYLVLLALIAIFCRAAYANFGGAIRGTTDRAEQRVRTLTGGQGGGGSGGGGSGGAPSGGPVAGSNGGSSSHGGPMGGGATTAVLGPICTTEGCSDGVNCFVAGTPVMTPQGPRAIELLRVGDEVVSRDESTGDVATERIRATTTTPAMPLVSVEIVRPGAQGTESIYSTTGHLYWTPDQFWTRADQLRAGDALLDVSGAHLRVHDVRLVTSPDSVYGLDVESHSYFVGTVGAWVHNPESEEVGSTRGAR